MKLRTGVGHVLSAFHNRAPRYGHLPGAQKGKSLEKIAGAAALAVAPRLLYSGHVPFDLDSR